MKQVQGTARDIAAYAETFESTGLRSPDGDVPPLEAGLCRARAQRQVPRQILCTNI